MPVQGLGLEPGLEPGLELAVVLAVELAVELGLRQVPLAPMPPLQPVV